MIHNSLFSIRGLHQQLFFLLLALLPTQLGFHFWPDWTYVLGRRIDYLSPTLYLTDMLIACTLISWLLEQVFRIRNHESGIMIKKKRFLSLFSIHNSLFIILFVMFAVLNIWFAASPPVALYAWFKVLEFALLGWYIMKTKPSFSRVTLGLSIGVLYSSVIALGQFYFQRSLGGSLWLLGERTFTVTTPGIARLSWCMSQPSGCRELLRAYGTFPHPNVLGGFVAITSVCMVGLLLEQGKKLGRLLWWYWTALLLGIAALIMTFSRSAWTAAGLGVGSMYYVVWSKHRQTFFGSFFIILFVALLLLSIISRPLPTDESVVVRADLIKSALTLWQQSPLFGIGLGNFLVDLPRVLPQRQIYFLQPVHNIYLLLLSEIGLVGIGLIAFLIVYLVKHESGIMNYGKISKEKFIIHNSLFIILILGLIDHYPLTLQQGQLLLTIVVGLVISEHSRIKGRSREERGIS